MCQSRNITKIPSRWVEGRAKGESQLPGCPVSLLMLQIELFYLVNEAQVLPGREGKYVLVGMQMSMEETLLMGRMP